MLSGLVCHIFYCRKVATFLHLSYTRIYCTLSYIRRAHLHVIVHECMTIPHFLIYVLCIEYVIRQTLIIMLSCIRITQCPRYMVFSVTFSTAGKLRLSLNLSYTSMNQNFLYTFLHAYAHLHVMLYAHTTFHNLCPMSNTHPACHYHPVCLTHHSQHLVHQKHHYHFMHLVH